MDNSLKKDLPPIVGDHMFSMVDNKKDDEEENQGNGIERVIAALGLFVSGKRDEAVRARKESGIEEIWDKADEYYMGIDDVNRNTLKWIKPFGESGGLLARVQNTGNDMRCRAFCNKTRNFVDNAAARLGDILSPAGDWNFAIEATPVQDVKFQGMGGGEGTDTKAMQAEAEKKAKNAEEKIHDWLIESSDHTECRRMFEDAARLGVGILYGPFTGKRKVKKFNNNGDGVFSLELVEELSPVSKRIPPRDFYPDPACRDDVQNGNFVVLRDRMTARKLRALCGTPGYDSKLIYEIIEEGPAKQNINEMTLEPKTRTGESEIFTVWTYIGDVPVENLEGIIELDEEQSKAHTAHAVVVFVNEKPIRAFVNPLESGDLPFSVFCWQERFGFWAGIGISEQCFVPQDTLNAAFRNLMENAGMGGGPITMYRHGMVEAMDGDMRLCARKVFAIKPDPLQEIQRIDDIIRFINVPMVQNELAGIMAIAEKQFEEATGMYYLLQGQQGSAPDTVGGMELLHRNASAILRRMARVFDERVTERRIRWYYEWLMMDPDIPEDCKGDMKIQALGSSSLVEREVQALEAMQMFQMALNPASGLDPEKAAEELLKAKRLPHSKWKLDEEKKQAMAQNQPQDPRIISAQINAQARMQAAQIAAQVTVDKAKADTDRDVQYTNALMRRDQMSAQQRMEEMKLKRELAYMEYANKHQITVEQAKTRMAETVMKLRTQRELSGVRTSSKNMQTPPTEPAGRAEVGRSFEQ